MGEWTPPRYDVGAGQHLADPTDPQACLCGKRWGSPPSKEEWDEHRFGPEDAAVDAVEQTSGP